MVFDRQSERTTSELYLQGLAGHDKFDSEFALYMRTLLPLAAKHGFRMITNAGGEDPEAALRCAVEVSRSLGLNKKIKIAASRNVDVLDTVLEYDPVLVETGERLSQLDSKPVGATVYLGADAIVKGLDAGADLVITGRVGDSTLYMAPMVHEFGWDWTDWTKLGRGMGIGHCMECGPQVTGGYFASPPYKLVPDLETVGLPYVEVEPNGDGVITKLPETGGKVTVPIVKEQLLYEVGNPGRYIHPDVIVDFTTTTLDQDGPDRVKISGTSGHPRPDTLKVLVLVPEGFIGESYIQFGGSDCFERAKYAAEVMQRRLNVRQIEPLEFRAAYIGVDSLFAPWGDQPVVPREVMLHLAGRFRAREEAEWFVKDCFIGAGNHYGPAAGTPGRNLMPIDAAPTAYSCLLPRSAVVLPDLVMEEVS
jgi:hypothetical protein